MKRLVLLCLLLTGCTQPTELQNEPIALLYATEEVSKTDALTAGDEVFVYASVYGTQNYFLENSRWTVGPDGKALVAPAPVFYPDAKQAVGFYAYFGSQHVPTDQSLPADLKKADLCWASVSSTPSNAPVTLAFSHVFARLAVTCNAPTSKILIPSAFSGGTLDIRTGVFINSTKSDVFTAQNELIVPAQTLHRLLLTSGGVDYVFDGSIALEAGKTTTVNLTLNTAAKTASLAGSSVSAWTASAQSGAMEQAVSNTLALHWVPAHTQSNQVNKVVLTIGGADYTINSGIVWSNGTFTVPFASAVLHYPFAIQKIAFCTSAETIQVCTQLLGAAMYKSGTATVGIKDPASAVKIGNLWWATGNLVADGPNGCKIGAVNDYGLNFGFGSLLGWSGGNAAKGDGTGQGYPALSVAVRPTGYTGGLSFGSAQYHAAPIGTEYCLMQTDNPTAGLGDPCRYYLGPGWLTPTYTQFRTVFPTATAVWSSWPRDTFVWQQTPVQRAYSSTYDLVFVYSNFRSSSVSGEFSTTPQTAIRTASRATGTSEYVLGFPPNGVGVCLHGNSNFGNAGQVRCVRPVL